MSRQIPREADDFMRRRGWGRHEQEPGQLGRREGEYPAEATLGQLSLSDELSASPLPIDSSADPHVLANGRQGGPVSAPRSSPDNTTPGGRTSSGQTTDVLRQEGNEVGRQDALSSRAGSEGIRAPGVAVAETLAARLTAGLPDSLKSEVLSDLEFEADYAHAFGRLTQTPVFGSVEDAPRFPCVVLDEGRWRYVRRRGSHPVPLAEAYAGLVSKRWGERRGTELTRWTRRLVLEGGLVPVPEIPVRLPAGLPAYAHRTWGAIVSLVVVRVIVGDLEPFPMTDTFLSEWSGGSVSVSEAKRAKRLLREAGVICRDGSGHSKHRRPATHWRIAESSTS
jgi:hypothetical protein